ncbi:MAG: pyridoxal phosphate-dependent aminotransferase [Candidatus Promineifilaceae bacterium]
MNFPLPPLPRSKTRNEPEDVRRDYGVDIVYRMANNESILGPSPAVVAAIAEEATKLGDYPPFGDETVRHALAEVWGRGLTPEHFYTSCSGFEALELATRAFLKADDEVIICNPTFMAAYGKVTTVQHAKLVDVPLLLPDFAVDVDGILAAINERTKILVLCNPNNPTGTVMPAATMQRLMDALPDHVLVISDEVYFHFVQDAAFPDSVQYVLEDRPIILVHSFSKAYGMAGLRMGYAIAPPRIANYIAGLHRGFHQNRLAQVAAVAAIGDQAHLRANVQTALDGKAYLMAEFDRLDLAYIPSATNFLILQLPSHLKDSDVVQSLLEQGIMVRSPKGHGLENVIRVSVGSAEANQAFVAAMEQLLS